MTPAEFEALRRLAEARKTADLAALEKLAAARREALAEMEQLRATRAAEGAAPLGALPPDRLALRLVFAERREAELRARVAELDQRISRARAVAAVSLGKDQALGDLRDRAAREAARARATRRERDAPPPEERRDDFE